MREVWVIFLYGMLSMTGAFLTAFWGLLAVRRFRALPNWRSRREDRYLALAGGLAIFFLGIWFVASARAHGNIMEGISPIISGGRGRMIETGLTFELIGAAVIVWLADLEAARRRVWLAIMLALGGAWMLFCLYLKGLIG